MTEEKPNAPQYKTQKAGKKRGAIKRHISLPGLYTHTRVSLSLSLSFHFSLPQVLVSTLQRDGGAVSWEQVVFFVSAL